MHSVHYSKKTENDFIGSAFGIIFDTTNYTADLTPAEVLVIDTFFESLDMTQKKAGSEYVMNVNDPNVDLVAFAGLMNMVDGKNRWMYAGGLTTPPCTTKVLFNILRTVYPIK